MNKRSFFSSLKRARSTKIPHREHWSLFAKLCFAQEGLFMGEEDYFFDSIKRTILSYRPFVLNRSWEYQFIFFKNKIW